MNIFALLGRFTKCQIVLKANKLTMKFTKTKKRTGLFLLVLILILLIGLFPLPTQSPVQYYDRESGDLLVEKIPAERGLVWLYNNPVGELTLWALMKRKFVSTQYGKRMDRPASAKAIEPFIEEFDIDMTAFQEQKFETFNEFFYRKLKDGARSVDTLANSVVSPADGKLLAYEDISNSDFFVKGYRFDVATFLNDSELAEKYLDGTLLIIRLAPADYHRYHFPIDGKVSPNIQIDGDYYSVNPLALRKRMEIFCLNKREYTIVSNPLFGDVIMAEVGATMVGSMVQTYSGDFIHKGQEKGYFKFGGSTVVLLFEKDKIKIDKDLLTNSVKGHETYVKQGERIGLSEVKSTL